MGASNIEFKLPKSEYPTADAVKVWYKKAVDQAEYESGHNPYNGTISTTKGIKFLLDVFLDEAKAYDYALDNSEKWGRMGCVTLLENGKHYWIISGWAAS